MYRLYSSVGMNIDAEAIEIFEYLMSKHRLSDDDARGILSEAKCIAMARNHETITMEDLLLAVWEEHTVAKHCWHRAIEKIHWDEENESHIILDGIIDDIEITLNVLRDFKSKGGLRIRSSAWWQLLECSVSITDPLQSSTPNIKP